MKQQSLYYVILRPEYIHLFQQFEGKVVSKDGLIHCRAVKHGNHYLEVEAHMGELHGDGHWFYLSIHHSAVLYIVSSPEDNISKVLGFHVSQGSVDTPKG